MASPAGQPPGRAPNGASVPLRRPPPKPSAFNPLVQKKKPQKSRPQGGPGGQPRSTATNGLRPAPSLAPAAPRDLQTMPYGDSSPSLFSKPPPAGSYTDFPVVMSKKALMEGLRHHVARFSARKAVDPRDPTQFSRPLHLLRRDVRAPMPGTEEWEAMQAEQRAKDEEGEEDAERRAAKEAATADIAPSLQKKKPKPIRKKAKGPQTRSLNPEKKESMQVKYEEALPWHLEDDELNQIWMGAYADASSKVWTQFKFENGSQGPRYVITPLEKWYTFVPKTRLTAEQMKFAEANRMKKGKSGSPEPNFMNAFIKAEAQELEQKRDQRNAAGKLFVGKLKSENPVAREHEDLDFEEDFADDEAPPAIEGDETEVKEAEERIKKDQLKANIFDARTLRDYEEDEQLEKLQQKLREAQGKKVQKALYKHEKNHMYERERGRDPYASDSTDTEEELEREIERKKQEEAKAAEAAAANDAGVKVKSEPGSRNNTPGHRPNKHPDPLHRTAASLKRPGSPNLSDASGNESTAARKKVKVKNAPSKLLSNIPSRTHSPAPSANGVRAVPGTNRSFAAGSGSDTEGGGPRKLKLTSPRSPTGSPGPSRMASRAGSPALVAAQINKPTIQIPESSAALREYIPVEGITMPALVNKFFGGNVVDKAKKQALVRLVQEIAQYDKSTKLLKPKGV